MLFRIPSLSFKLDDDDLMSAYICSKNNNYGMHKCGDLPLYKNGTLDCTLTVEEAKYKTGCINWNQVHILTSKI